MTKYTVIVVFLQLFIPLAGHLTQNIIQDVIQHEKTVEMGCSVDVAGYEQIEWCNIPSNSNTSVDDLVYPPYTKCAFMTSNATVICKGCYENKWHTTSCTKDIYVRREKRFIFLIALIVCYYYCRGSRRDTYKPPRISCYGPGDVYANRGENGAVVSWKSPKGYNGKGKSLSPKLINGYRSGSTFGRGNHAVGYAVTDDRNNKATCYVTFTVKVRTCSPVQWPTNGRKRCEGEMIWGKSCSIKCDPGYELKGSSKLTCEKSGKYDNSLPSCEAISCPDVKPTSKGTKYTCPNGRKYRSTCRAMCSEGYRFHLSSYTTCQETGQWREPLPQCIDDADPVFDNCPENSIVVYAEPRITGAHVQYEPLTASDNSGSAKIEKVQGFSSGSLFDIGFHTVQYKAEDSAGNKAFCYFAISVQELTCGVPDFNDKSMKIDCPDGYKLGSECAISCKSGLPLEGSNVIMCDSDNSDPPKTFWNFGNDTQPLCKTRPCNNLTAPLNGALACDKWASGTFCTMMCNAKYDLPRNVAIARQFICGWSTGFWSPSSIVPDCTETRRPSRMILPSEFYYYDGDCSTNMDTIKTNFLNILRGSNIWVQACPVVKDCTVENVDVTCGLTSRRKKRAAKSEDTRMLILFNIAIPFDLNGETPDEAKEKHTNKLKALADGIKKDVTNGIYNKVAPGFTLADDSVQFGYEDFECPEGQVASFGTVSCRGCSSGMMYNSASKNCTYCPKGFYQDDQFSTSCKSCPIGLSTVEEGARNDTDCLDICTIGESSPTGLAPCSPCSPGTYQDTEGSINCTLCPPDTSSEIGSTTAANCSAYDVLLKGPVTLRSSIFLKTEVDNFTLSVWFRRTMQPASDFNITFYNTIGEILTIALASSIDILVLGSKEEVDVQISEQWNHVILAWQLTEGQLDVYVGGQLVHQKSLRPDMIMLFQEGTEMEIKLKVNDNNGVMLRRVELIPDLLNTSTILELSQSCDLALWQTTLFSLKELKADNKNNSRIIMPSLCDAMDECLSSPCEQHSACINEIGGFRCKCYGGYSGELCTTPPDYCLSNGCKNGATCSNVPAQQTFNCTCPEGFKGTLCEVPIVNGEWGNWTQWSECSVTCGGGIQYRERLCDYPAPDDDGQTCQGNSTDMQSCNTKKCLECISSHLKRAYGSSVKCNGSKSALTCKLVCRPGLVFSGNGPENFTCEHGIWNPGTTLSPCIFIKSARRLELKTKAIFPSVNCDHHKEFKTKVNEKIRQKTCAANNECKYDIKVPDCNHGNRNQRAAEITVDIVMSKELPEGDLDLAAYQVNGTVSPQLRSIVDAIQIMEKTGQVLQNETDAITVTVNNEMYTASSVGVIGESICPTGTEGNGGLCGDCPAGTYEKNNKCLDCGLGYYQDEPAATQCKPCPVDSTTFFLSSMDIDDCISTRSTMENSLSTMENSLSTTEIPSPDKQNHTVIIATVLISILIIAILIAVLIYIFHYRERQRRSLKKTLHQGEEMSPVSNQLYLST